MESRSFNVTVSRELADIVEAKVASGEYGSEAEVISDGLLLLAERDSGTETWLVEHVAATYDAVLADPDGILSASEAWARIETYMAAGAIRRT